MSKLPREKARLGGRAKILERAGLTEEGWAKIISGEDDITLSRIIEIEHDLWTSFITPSFTYKFRDVFEDSTSGRSIVETLNANPLPVYSKELVEELKVVDAKYRFVKTFSGNYLIVFKVPKDIADKHGLKYVYWSELAREERESGKFNPIDDDLVLTDDGFVIPCYGILYMIKMRNKLGFVNLLYTPWGRAEYYLSGSPFRFVCSDSVEKLWTVGKKFGYRKDDEYLGLRMTMLQDDMYAAAYIATGDHEIAESICYPVSQMKIRAAKNLKGSIKVREHMAEDIRNSLNRILKERGIEGDGEGYVFKTLIDMTEEIMNSFRNGEASDKMLAVAQSNLDKIAKFISMGPDVVTTERSLQIGSGNSAYLAKQIEERRIKGDEIGAEFTVE